MVDEHALHLRQHSMQFVLELRPAMQVFNCHSAINVPNHVFLVTGRSEEGKEEDIFGRMKQ